MQSETGIVAVPTAADTWTRVTLFTVPANASRITKVRFAVAPDWGVTAVSVRAAPIFRLRGSGLGEQDPHEYVGMFGGVAVVTTAGLQQNEMAVSYNVDIPVSTGGTVDVEVNSLDEAITAGTVLVNLFYDDGAVTQKNSMSQYVDAAGTTTADAYSSVGTFTIPLGEEGKKPTKIRAVILAVAIDQGTSAISLRTASRFRLTGSGINEGGLHEYVGPAQTSSDCGTSASQGTASDSATVFIPVDIPINAGAQILAEHRFEVETPTASTVAVGLLYE